LPIDIRSQRRKGNFYIKTPLGYYRTAYLVVSMDEVYIYSSKESEKPMKVYVISGAFIKKVAPTKVKD
jgi:hypothetical protein